MLRTPSRKAAASESTFRVMRCLSTSAAFVRASFPKPAASALACGRLCKTIQNKNVLSSCQPVLQKPNGYGNEMEDVTTQANTKNAFSQWTDNAGDKYRV